MPFYVKIGENWEVVDKPTDIRRRSDNRVLGSVFPGVLFHGEVDREQMMVFVSAGAAAYAVTEDGGYIFPQSEGVPCNRRDVFFIDLRHGNVIAVIHSEQPIGQKPKKKKI